MSDIAISVVIPTHNRPDGLTAAIQSIAGQTVLPLEIVVVDDGSEKPVDDAVFQDIPDGIRTLLIRNETPEGAPKARNRGIRHARGDWIAFLDDDDAFFSEKIETIARSIQENPEVDLIYHPAEINMVRENVRYRSGVRDLNKSGDIYRQLLIRNMVGGTSMTALKRKTLMEVGGFDEKLPPMEDWELWIRIALKGGRFLFVDKILTRYYHDTAARSLTRDYDKTGKAYTILQDKYASDYAKLKPKDKKKFRKEKLQSEVFQALLNKNIKAARKKQLQLAQISRHPLDFFKFLGMVIWPGSVFAMRAKLNLFLK